MRGEDPSSLIPHPSSLIPPVLRSRGDAGNRTADDIAHLSAADPGDSFDGRHPTGVCDALVKARGRRHMLGVGQEIGDLLIAPDIVLEDRVDHTVQQIAKLTDDTRLLSNLADSGLSLILTSFQMAFRQRPDAILIADEQNQRPPVGVVAEDNTAGGADEMSAHWSPNMRLTLLSSCTHHWAKPLLLVTCEIFSSWPLASSTPISTISRPLIRLVLCR